MSANPNGQCMPRVERHAQVTRLKQAGLTFKEIAGLLGVAVSTATSAYYDPTGAVDRSRKLKYQKPCIDCGALHGLGERDPGERCARCATERQKTDRAYRQRQGARKAGQTTWTDEAILAAIREIARPDGTASCGDYTARRAATPDAFPSLPTIIKRFAKWSHAVEAAGLSTKSKPYRDRVDRTPDEGMILAVQDCAAEVGRVPTYSEYEVWARLGGAPSACGVRGRFGNWMRVLEIAFPDAWHRNGAGA